MQNPCSFTGSGYEREESVKKPVPGIQFVLSYLFSMFVLSHAISMDTAGNFDNAMTSDQFFSWLTDKGISSGDIQVLKGKYFERGSVLIDFAVFFCL